LSDSGSDFRCNHCGAVFDAQLVAEHLCNPKIANVADCYKEWTKELIKDDLDKKSYNISVLMSNLLGDFNIGSVVRSANALGAREVFYFGKKHIDKRGCVGTHNYTKINYVNIEDIFKLKEKYVFVALENNRNYKIENLKEFIWPKDKEILLILGEEGLGISDELLKISDHIVEIPLTGSVRSLNVASACTVALYDFIAKYGEK
jgi:tRNA G18 (ribose-2'-O)-methylase SpoU